MISIKGVSKKFGKLQVLKDINLGLAASQVVALIGPNGSGKTTLIKILLGLVMKDRGEITINGQELDQSWSYKSQIGYMSQISRFPENIRIGELFRMMKDIRSDCSRYDHDLLDTYHLEEMYDKPLGTLSGGTKQKVSAALAFMFNPSILVLDEPTAGLDPVATEHIKHKIRMEKEKGKLLLVTSHIMSDIEELADTMVFMTEGEIRFNMPLKEVKEKTGETLLNRAVANMMEKYGIR